MRNLKCPTPPINCFMSIIHPIRIMSYYGLLPIWQTLKLAGAKFQMRQYLLLPIYLASYSFNLRSCSATADHNFNSPSCPWEWCFKSLHGFLQFMMTSSNGNIFRVTGHLCGEFTGPGEFPTQRPVTRSFDVYFDLRPNKWLSKQ